MQNSEHTSLVDKQALILRSAHHPYYVGMKVTITRELPDNIFGVDKPDKDWIVPREFLLVLEDKS